MYEDENEDLIIAVLEQIREDVSNGDLTAIEQLIEMQAPAALLNFLPEEKQAKFLEDFG